MFNTSKQNILKSSWWQKQLAQTFNFSKYCSIKIDNVHCKIFRFKETDWRHTSVVQTFTNRKTNWFETSWWKNSGWAGPLGAPGGLVNYVFTPIKLLRPKGQQSDYILGKVISMEYYSDETFILRKNFVQDDPFFCVGLLTVLRARRRILNVRYIFKIIVWMNNYNALILSEIG